MHSQRMARRLLTAVVVEAVLVIGLVGYAWSGQTWRPWLRERAAAG